MAESELDDYPGLMLVDIALDRSNEDDMQVRFGQAIKRPEFGRQEGLTPDDLVGLVGQAVELEVDEGPEGSEPREPIRMVQSVAT